MMNLREISDAIGGHFLSGEQEAGQTDIKAISIDSRQIMDVSACLFFAIRGPRHDGHDYLSGLYQRGVRNFVVSSIAGNMDYNDAAVILVQDSLQALRLLAAHVRAQHDYPVLGITGSNGKTIVKEWLFELLQDDLRIIRSPKSYNSQVGVPLSVWNMQGGRYELAIFEAGISEPGEMKKLTAVIAPTQGLITNIGDAHQENFQSREQKAEEKTGLFESCELIVYRKDQQVVHGQLARRYGEGKVRLFGWSGSDPEASLYVRAGINEAGSILSFSHGGKPMMVRIPFSDEASIENACHCLAFIVATGRWNDRMADRFAALEPVAMRLELKQGINGCSLINDYYNSDIHSLEIALQFLHRQSVSGRKSKTLIISDIRQSGMDSAQLAGEVVRLTRLYGIDRLTVIGEQLVQHRSLFESGTLFFKATEEFLAQFNPAHFSNEQILLKGAREFHFERIAAVLQQKYHQTQMEVDLNAMITNLNRHRMLLDPQTRIMIMVKAFSYGSGNIEIAKALEFQKVDYLAVAVADEGIDLRQAGIGTPVIVMNPEEHSFEMMLEYRLEPNIYSEEVFRKFDQAAKRMAVSDYPVHLKIESGMNRLGFSSEQELLPVCKSIAASGRLRVHSVFSHLAVSDDPAQDEFTRHQYGRFKKLSDLVLASQPHPVMRHLLNSAGIERFPEYQMEMVRLGIGLYGISQSAAFQVDTVARWTTVVSQVREVEAGETIGYGRRGKADRPGKIAVIPVGYADGYDRRLSNGAGRVWIEGHFFPVIGNICMDMTMIDVSDADVKSGDPVELMGDHVKLTDLAKRMKTIPYEVLTGISQRVRRIYIQE